MTSELKCPICGGDIRYNDSYSTYDCKNNPAEHHASEEVWQALIESQKTLVLSEQSADREIHRLRDLLSQSQKDLEIATKALEKADGFFEGIIGLYQSEMMAIIKTALEQIEHKES